MAKRIIGSYRSEATALQKIDQLLTEGYSKESITLVTNPDTKKSIHSQTDIEIEILSSGSKEDESLGDKIKDFFSLRSQIDDELHSAIPDEEVLADYKKAIEKGSTLILVEKKASSDTAETTYPIDVDTLEDGPSSSVKDGKQTRAIRTQHLDYDNEDLITDINIDGDLEIEDDFPPTESPDRTDFY